MVPPLVRSMLQLQLLLIPFRRPKFRVPAVRPVPHVFALLLIEILEGMPQKVRTAMSPLSRPFRRPTECSRGLLT